MRLDPHAAQPGPPVRCKVPPVDKLSRTGSSGENFSSTSRRPPTTPGFGAPEDAHLLHARLPNIQFERRMPVDLRLHDGSEGRTEVSFPAAAGPKHLQLIGLADRWMTNFRCQRSRRLQAARNSPPAVLLTRPAVSRAQAVHRFAPSSPARKVANNRRQPSRMTAVLFPIASASPPSLR